MSNPYYWEFPQKSDTMFLSTIQNKSNFMPRASRKQSAFQPLDIDGAAPRQQIPKIVNKTNFSLSSSIQPSPEYWRSIKKKSDPLKHDDIEGSMPKAVEFNTQRVINPLVPRYKLPSADPVDIAPPAKFLRNTLDISDIVKKKKNKFIESPKNQPIEGSVPSKLHRTIDTISRLSVKDINNDGLFVSKRRDNPTDPLTPSYIWKDQTYNNMGLSFTKSTLQQEPKVTNERYGNIERPKGNRFQSQFKDKARKSLNVSDIEGAQSNSANERKYFFERRKDFREYMKIDDIGKTGASSLKKGIVTSRNVNPLMPNYKYPQ